MRSVQPYSALAVCYDLVMDYVDYEGWVDFVTGLLDRHNHEPRNVLELGCGTGAFARLFTSGTDCNYRATDGSRDMIEQAKRNSDSDDIDYQILDFSADDFPDGRDTIFLLFDGLNYLLEESGVTGLLSRVRSALSPGGIAVIDQSTPENSIRNSAFFEDSGSSGEISFVRSSAYDIEHQIHTTTFEITSGNDIFEEIHQQRCYSIETMRGLIRESGLKIDGVYDGFSYETADNESERIHWVLRKP